MSTYVELGCTSQFHNKLTLLLLTTLLPLLRPAPISSQVNLLAAPLISPPLSCMLTLLQHLLVLSIERVQVMSPSNR